MFVTTLPLEVHANNNYTKLYSPFFASLVSRYFCAKQILSINTLGRKHREQSHGYIKENIDRYLHVLYDLGIDNCFVWQDNFEEYSDYVSFIVKILFSFGEIFICEDEIYTCPCQIIEIEKNVVNDLYYTKFFRKDNSQYYCNKCNQPLKLKKCQSLKIRNNTSDYANINILPSKFLKDVKGLFNKDIINLRISRLRQANNIKISINEADFYLDTDFYWSIYLSFLLVKNQSKKCIIVTSNRTLLKALQVVTITKKLIKDIIIDIIVHPIISCQNDSISRMRIDEFIKIDSIDTLRFFLVAGLNWNLKDSTIESKELYWIKKSIDPEKIFINNDERLDITINNFFRTVNSNNLRDLLTNLRKKQEISAKQFILYKLLLKI